MINFVLLRICIYVWFVPYMLILIPWLIWLNTCINFLSSSIKFALMLPWKLVVAFNFLDKGRLIGFALVHIACWKGSVMVPIYELWGLVCGCHNFVFVYGIAWNVLIAIYVEHEHVEEALKWFISMTMLKKHCNGSNIWVARASLQMHVHVLMSMD